MKHLIILVCCFFIKAAWAQPPVTQPSPDTEQQIENITENNADEETDDDTYLQSLSEFSRNPINLNLADAATLEELLLLTPIQIDNFITYRTLLGKFLTIYEIQAIPGWDLATIQKIRPYIMVSQAVNLFNAIGSRLKNGDNILFVRSTQVLEKSRGYKLDSSQATNFYYGSPQRLFIRYKYSFKNLLQYGVVAEKDPGEELFKGSQKYGFDYYSVHFFMRNAGIVKALALGDFTVNLGQGLTQWMSQAYRKGPDITTIKRQAAVLRPYNSAGEINFHRGIGITVGKNNWEATLFGSYKKIDANFVAADTSLLEAEDIVTSLQTSGYHRTKSEVEDKGMQRQVAFGGNFKYRLYGLQIGVNAVQYQFKLPLQKSQYPYNQFALTGKTFGNYSIDYGYTYRNMHFFGEAASTNKRKLAFIQGMLMSVANNVDVSLLYRNISPAYQSLYTSAFTENTFPTNEKGLYTGISIKPAMGWRVDAYADVYKFPWLRYRVDAPTTGKEYMFQLTYQPNKIFSIYSRLRSESKPINYNPTGLTLNPVIPQPRQNWRTQLSVKLNSIFTFRSRVEMVWFDKRGSAAENGFTIFTDLLYNPMMKPLSGNIRLQYFETDGYNSRVYSYENDVLYGYPYRFFMIKDTVIILMLITILISAFLFGQNGRKPFTPIKPLLVQASMK